MKIAYITHEYPPDTGKGGIGTYTFQMAQAMNERGHEVEVFTSSFNREVTENYCGVTTHRVKIREYVDFKREVVKIFTVQHQKYPFNVIECPEIGGEAEFIKQKYPAIPLVVRLHTPAVLVTKLQNTYQSFSVKLRYVLGSLIHGRIDLGFWAQHDKNKHRDPDFLITQKADIITAPSSAMKQWAVNFWKIDKKRIKVIPNPYTPTEEILSVPIQTNNKRITFIGRLNVLKGLIALTQALPKVLSKHNNWTMRFIGNTENSHIEGFTMKQWMQEQLKTNKNNLEWVDWIDTKELPHYLHETDIVVIPSLFESFSYVCAEAMAAGRAIVGSNRGGMNGLLTNGAGILVNPQNPKQVAKAIIKLIENDNLRNIYGKKARQKMIDNYNSEIISEMIENIYKKYVHQ